MKRLGAEGAKALMICGVLLAGMPCQAADKIAGSVTADGEPATFAHGFAWIDGNHRVSVGFFAALPSEKEQTQKMSGSTPLTGVFGKPNLSVDLDFEKGATQASPAALTSCHVGYSGFGYGPFTLNNDKSSCGAVALSGRLAPGSVVHGTLKGRGESMFPQKDGHKAAFTWDVDFTATVRAKP
jgi:hypothetical protein